MEFAPVELLRFDDEYGLHWAKAFLKNPIRRAGCLAVVAQTSADRPLRAMHSQRQLLLSLQATRH